MLDIWVPCIHLLWSTITPLWRICKKVTPNCLFLACCYCWSQLSTLRSCCKSLCVLSTTTQGWANGALSPPQRIDEATRLRELEIAGCQTMALWPKWGGLHDRYSKTLLLTMVHSLQSHMSLPHSVNYSIVHNTQSHKLYWSTELWFHTHTRTFGQDYNTFSVWEIGLYL